ncbi:PREDICTED: uncharacterized protein LOC108770765 [Trachymyrmex cornetzi]|uniref:uncharacterized protein LOC108770765 n=1 Tax=Trachymyrmex cornetzi TaxID=471704 RepID=UPI00084F5FA7|nr:PREDICTED: uncharacterized protein LOC108770765 [Trachymyrmex cornetzi]XP_018377975.1 PREDICTED: uncharacterized protein LOC108770765 [Trachymyrmex cornetzi]
MADGRFYAVVEFEDGPQMIPNNWLDICVMKAVWPNFTNYKRYDKAVKLMEEPESTWIKHPIRKIYGIYTDYAVAQQKLKETEKLSNLSANTKKEEYLKKTRKIRAAKLLDSDSDEELSDDNSIKSLKLSIKKRCSTCLSTSVAKKQKIAKNAQEDLNRIHDTECLSTQNIITLDDCNIKKEKEDELASQSISFVDIEDIHSGNNDNDNNKDPLSNSNLNKKQDRQCDKNFSTVEEKNEDDNSESLAMPSFEQKLDNFQCFVIRKLINIEKTLKVIANDMNIFQMTVFQKLAISKNIVENEENIDVFADLPLKDENDLKIMERKLKDDPKYRNQMIKQLNRKTCGHVRSSCIRLIKVILSNKLALEYSWYGAKKKLVFSALEICKVMMSVLRHSHPNATDDELTNPIKVWLAHAKERLNRVKELQKEMNH